MVFELQFRNRFRLSVLSLLIASFFAPLAQADSGLAQEYLRSAQSFYHQGLYFKAARYAYAANEEDSNVRAEAYSWITLGLTHAGLYNASVYFFIRTLQTQNKAAIRRVLPQTPEYLVRLGADLIRPYLIRYTTYEDYDPMARSAYLYALGKDAILSGDEKRAVGYLNAIRQDSQIWPYALEMRGTAFAIMGQNDDALGDFRECEAQAPTLVDGIDSDSPRYVKTKRDAGDLKARCTAGESRTLYQAEDFQLADRTYDRIPKASLVWPDILFEQAWNSFGKQEYNRTLGKLVSYKSPALSFVFNPEVDVLRAQTYLALCLYDDANVTINDFNSKYVAVGEEVKKFVEHNQSNLPIFYQFGKEALRSSLYSKSDMNRMADRFVRGPYFQSLVSAEQDLYREKATISQFSNVSVESDRRGASGFSAFLSNVLGWRLKTIHLLGGAFVKNSFLDYHQALIADFEKMAFIKLEMLKRAKDQLLYHKAASTDRSRGNIIPSRRDDQFYWSFNGEFWNDELGDYVFGLESRCKGPPQDSPRESNDAS